MKKLDGLPLALATAGAYLGLTSMSVSEYLQNHETSWLELQRTSPPLLSYEDQTIYSTWNLSYIYIRKEDESAAKLLELWAYFDNQDLWYDLLKAGNDEFAPTWFKHVIGTKLAFQAAIAKLQKHALIESLIDSDGYAMHHCVHAWVKNVLCPTVEDQNLRLALSCVGEIVPVAPAPGDWIVRQRLTSHSERCLQLHRVCIDERKDSEEIELYFAMLFHNLGVLYHDQGKWTEAESMYQRAFNGKEKILGPDHTSTLVTVNNLGVLYRQQGKLTEAESMYQRALTGYEKAIGPDHKATLETVYSLGNLYSDQEDRLAEAESIYQRASAGCTRNPPSNPKLQLDIFYNWGLLSRDLQNFEKAKECFSKAYQGYQTLLGPENAETIDALKKFNVEIDRGK